MFEWQHENNNKEMKQEGNRRYPPFLWILNDIFNLAVYCRDREFPPEIKREEDWETSLNSSPFIVVNGPIVIRKMNSRIGLVFFILIHINARKLRACYFIQEVVKEFFWTY